MDRTESTTTRQEAPAGGRWLPLCIALLLAGITFWLYWPAGHFETVCYDDVLFTDNPEVQSGLNGQSFIWAMTRAVAANWHPVTSLSFVLTHQFFGSNPGAEHLVNVAFHALNAALLFLVLVRLTGRCPAQPKLKTPARGDSRPTTERSTGSMIWPCAVVAAVFAWHPLRVESVAWIAERKDVLCGFFMLLTMGAWHRYVGESKVQSPKSKVQRSEVGGQKPKAQSPKPKALYAFYGLSLLFFALGLMSKAMVVTLPFLLLLLDIWPLGRFPISDFRFPILKRLVVEKIPFLALTAVFCAVTFLVQRQEQATPSLQELGLGLRLENVIVSYLRYLGWTVWPAKLAMFYSFPYDQHFYLALWPGWQIAAGLLLLAGISGLCVMQLKRRPYLAVGWFWYLGMMVPVIGFVQVGSQGMADRYTYLPLIGPVISVVWLAAEAWRTGIFAKGLLTGLVTVILAASLCQTRQQLSFWKNTEALCRHTIEVTGENPRAEYIYGLGLEKQGDLQGAMRHYRNAISSQPRASQPRVKEAFYAMGRLFSQQGQWTMAEKTYATMLGDNPKDFEAHLGLAIALPHLDRTAEAVAHLKAAVQNCPDDAEALNNLAWTLAANPAAELRDGTQAVKCAERACTLTGYKETMMIGTLAAAYAEAGRFDEAMATAQKACAQATAAGKPELLKMNEQLLELYRQHQPYHEPASPER